MRLSFISLALPSWINAFSKANLNVEALSRYVGPLRYKCVCYYVNFYIMGLQLLLFSRDVGY